MGFGGGGGGSQPTNTTTTSTTEPPEFVKPFSEDLLSRASDLSTAPFPFDVPFDRVAPFNQFQETGLNLAAFQALNPDPLSTTAAGNLQSLFGDPGSSSFFGPLAGLAGGQQGPSFPLEESIAAAQGNIVDQFNQQVVPSTSARFAQGGAFGGSAQQELESTQRFGLARALGEVDIGLRRQAAELSLGDRALQTRAAESLGTAGLEAFGLAPNLGQAARQDPQQLFAAGAQQQQQQQREIQADVGEFLAEATFPFQQLDTLGSAIATAGGGFASSNVNNQGQFFPPTRDPFSSLLGLGLGGAALAGGK